MSTPRELTPGDKIRELIRAETNICGPSLYQLAAKITAAAQAFVEGGENQPPLDTSHLTDEMMKAAMGAGFPGLPSCMTLAEAERRMRAGLLAALGSTPRLDTSDARPTCPGCGEYGDKFTADAPCSNCGHEGETLWMVPAAVPSSLRAAMAEALVVAKRTEWDVDPEVQMILAPLRAALGDAA